MSVNNIIFLELDDTFDMSPNVENLVAGETLTYISGSEELLSVSSEGVATVQPGALEGDLILVEVHSSENGYVTTFFFIIGAPDGIPEVVTAEGITINVKPDVIVSVVRADPATRVQIFDHANEVVAEENVTSFGFARIAVPRQSVIAPGTNDKGIELTVARVIENNAVGTLITTQKASVVTPSAPTTTLSQEIKNVLLTPVTSTTTTVAPTTTTTTTTTAAPTTTTTTTVAYYGEAGYGEGGYGQ